MVEKKSYTDREGHLFKSLHGRVRTSLELLKQAVEETTLTTITYKTRKREYVVSRMAFCYHALKRYPNIPQEMLVKEFEIPVNRCTLPYYRDKFTDLLEVCKYTKECNDQIKERWQDLEILNAATKGEDEEYSLLTTMLKDLHKLSPVSLSVISAEVKTLLHIKLKVEGE